MLGVPSVVSLLVREDFLFWEMPLTLKTRAGYLSEVANKDSVRLFRDRKLWAALLMLFQTTWCT